MLSHPPIEMEPRGPVRRRQITALGTCCTAKGAPSVASLAVNPLPFLCRSRRIAGYDVCIEDAAGVPKGRGVCGPARGIALPVCPAKPFPLLPVAFQGYLAQKTKHSAAPDEPTTFVFRRGRLDQLFQPAFR